jgi:hypothetical protein
VRRDPPGSVRGSGLRVVSRTDDLQRQLSALFDTATDDERNELREIQPRLGWRGGGGLTLPHGNAAAALAVIATAEDEEWEGLLPHGSAQRLRHQLRSLLR